MDRQTISFIILVIVVLGIGYIWYSYYSAAPAEEGTAVEDLNVQNIEARLAELRRLRDLQLDTSLFREEAFRELQLPVIPKLPAVQIGRVNPFLPF